VGRLEVPQLAKKAVELRVGQVRCVEDIVRVVRLGKNAAEFRRALPEGGIAQRPFASSDRTVIEISTSRSSSSAEALDSIPSAHASLEP
jgi:hypothetical protein